MLVWFVCNLHNTPQTTNIKAVTCGWLTYLQCLSKFVEPVSKASKNIKLVLKTINVKNQRVEIFNLVHTILKNSFLKLLGVHYFLFIVVEYFENQNFLGLPYRGEIFISSEVALSFMVLPEKVLMRKLGQKSVLKSRKSFKKLLNLTSFRKIMEYDGF